MKCPICQKEFKNIDSLLRHVYLHGYDTKSFYDDFVKLAEEGRCAICGKQTSFINFHLGYRKYCCKKCAGIGSESKRAKTKYERYGDKHYTNIAKRINTMNEKNDI